MPALLPPDSTNSIICSQLWFHTTLRKFVQYRVIAWVGNRKPPGYLGNIARFAMIASYVALGEMDQAKTVADFYISAGYSDVGFQLDFWFHYKNPADRQRIENDLIKAGLQVK